MSDPEQAHMLLGGGYASASLDDKQNPASFDIQIETELTTYTSIYRTIYSKGHGAGNRGSHISWTDPYRMQNLASTDGASQQTLFSAWPLPVAANEHIWSRMTWDHLLGQWYNWYAKVEGNWIQTGSAGTGLSGPAFNSQNAAFIGAAGGANPAYGKIYRARVFDLQSGECVLDFDPKGHDKLTTWVSVTGETWTLNGVAEIIDPNAASLPLPIQPGSGPDRTLPDDEYAALKAL